MAKKKTTEEFIKQARIVHNNKYDYTKTVYINNKNKICVICPIHGEFWVTPNNHLKGQNCSKCRYEKLSKERRCGIECFVEKAKEIHGDKYDYSKVEYINNHTKVCIICPKHGEFWQEPAAHLQGQGCRKCYNEQISSRQTLDVKDFIESAHKIHGDKYDYSKVEYVNNKTKVCIICPKHGEFWQVPNSHLRGCGCSKCHNSRLEDSVCRYLEKEKIELYKGHIFLGLENNTLTFIYRNIMLQ